MSNDKSIIFPDTIRIHGHTWTVEPLGRELARDWAGDFNTTQQRIRIDEAANSESQGQIMLHELVEALSGMYQLELEHPQVQGLSQALFAVFRDNPEVAKLIAGVAS